VVPASECDVLILGSGTPAGPYYIGAGHSIGCSAVFSMVAARHMAS
jgi:hypothetical protein